MIAASINSRAAALAYLAGCDSRFSSAHAGKQVAAVDCFVALGPVELQRLVSSAKGSLHGWPAFASRADAIELQGVFSRLLSCQRSRFSRNLDVGVSAGAHPDTVLSIPSKVASGTVSAAAPNSAQAKVFDQVHFLFLSLDTGFPKG